jgi:hypothetical protein
VLLLVLLFFQLIFDNSFWALLEMSVGNNFINKQPKWNANARASEAHAFYLSTVGHL